MSEFVLSSDAFFPFRDNIDRSAAVEISFSFIYVETSYIYYLLFFTVRRKIYCKPRWFHPWCQCYSERKRKWIGTHSLGFAFVSSLSAFFILICYHLFVMWPIGFMNDHPYYRFVLRIIYHMSNKEDYLHVIFFLLCFFLIYEQ